MGSYTSQIMYNNLFHLKVNHTKVEHKWISKNTF